MDFEITAPPNRGHHGDAEIDQGIHGSTVEHAASGLP
jgi:hypothetical protein